MLFIPLKSDLLTFSEYDAISGAIINPREKGSRSTLRIRILPGSAEATKNGNGLLSEFFPKKTDFATVSETELNEALRLINNRPRKYLKWRTANEALMDEVLHLI